MRFQCPFCQGIVAVANTDMGIECQCGHCSEIVTVPSYRLSTGAVIADFIILEELGRGGMGIVFLAHQMTLDRAAALKILSDTYAGDPEFVVDFIKEARAAAKLNHPHIVQAYAVGEDEGVFFFAMEHIDGETMKTYLKREGTVPVEFALEVIQQIAEALDYAWKEQRLIHRDIKPDNIMLTKNGRAKLADLGLARIAGEIDDSEEDEVMGTPQYISPEHLTGAEMDIRSDIYSLGATLFHLVTGRFAFEGRTATDIARKHLEEPLINPQELNPQISDGVANIIFKMMAKNANDRYQHAADLVEDLNSVRKGKELSSTTTTPTGKFGKKSFSKKSGGKTLSMKSTSTGAHPHAMNLHKTGSDLKGTHLNLTSTGTNHNIDEEDIDQDKKKKSKVGIIVLAVLVVLLMVGGGLFYLIKPSSDEVKIAPDKRKKISKKVIQKKSKEPQVTKYTKSISKILEFSRALPNNKDSILTQCDLFFAEFPSPTYKCDKRSLNYLLDIYIPIDESKRIIKARELLRKKHLLTLKKNSDLKVKIAAKKALRERAKARKELEAKMVLERKEKEIKRLKDYQDGLEISKSKLIYRAFYYSFGKKYKQAEAVFSSALKEPQRVSGLKKVDALKYAKWGKKIQSAFIVAGQTWSTLFNASKKLNGVQIEIKRGILGKVISIKNGKISVKTFSGKKVTIPLSQLSIKQFKKLTEKVGELLNNPNATFFYMLCAGEFKMAKSACPDDWSSSCEEMIVAYLKNRIKIVFSIDDEKEQRKEKLKLKKYSRMTEFKKARKLLKNERSDDDL